MKFILFFSLFLFTSLFARELQISDNIPLNASSYMEYYVDKNDSLDISKINNVVWKELKNSNLGSAKNYSSWTRFSLYNSSAMHKTLYLENPRAGMDEIDVYVIKENTQLYHLGDARPMSNRDVIHPSSIVKIDLEPTQKVEVVTRLKNTIGSTEGEWIVHNERDFYTSFVKSSLWWGFFSGIIVALMVYVVPILRTIRDRFITIFFALYVFSSLIYQFSLNGYIYMLGIYGKYINFVVLFSGDSFGLFGILFIIQFLRIQNKKGVIYHTSLIFAGLLVLEYIILILSLFSIKAMSLVGLINVYVGLFGYLVWFAMFFQFFRFIKDKIFIYFFSGYSVVIFAYALQALVNTGVMEISWISIYSVSIATLCEIILFVIGINKYIYQLQEDQIQKNKLISYQMRFASIGKAIGNISHQWKVPLVRLGALATYMETLLTFKQEVLVDELKEIVPKLRMNLEFMQNSVDEFYQLYSSQAQVNLFSPSDMIRDIWDMLSAKALKSNARININDSFQGKINSYGHTFSHVILICLDNILDIADARGIRSPQVSVSIALEKEKLCITIEDNCGGISQKPIYSIFESDISSKNSPEQIGGMGLNIAKMMMENKLQGTIQASNTQDGAKFTLLLAHTLTA